MATEGYLAGDALGAGTLRPFVLPVILDRFLISVIFAHTNRVFGVPCCVPPSLIVRGDYRG